MIIPKVKRHIVFFFIYVYFSRFMQPNYLGYLLDLAALAYLIDPPVNEEMKGWQGEEVTG